MKKTKKRIRKVVLDGGPCGGKTDGFTATTTRLEKLGYIPLVVPEAATILINGGIKPDAIGPEKFQRLVVRKQIENEKIFEEAALSYEKKYGMESILLCDRGILSGAAYLPGDNNLEDFERKILSSYKLSTEKARSEYIGVVLYATAADGAVEFFNNDNPARKETPAQAFERCLRSRSVWLGHSHVSLILNRDKDNRQVSYKEKIDNGISKIFGYLGIPEPLEIEDKYVLSSFDPNELPVKHVAINIEQDYLIPNIADEEERVRRRMWLNGYSYYHGIKKPSPTGGRIEHDPAVSEREYIDLFARRDLSKVTIRKKRYCFLWGSQYFEVDVYDGHRKGLLILENEHALHEETIVPPFLKIAKNVTNDSEYSNFNLANR